MRTFLATSALTGAVLTTLLAGCSEAEDIAKGAAEDAGCAVAQRAADEAERRTREAVADIGADPQAAERELRAVRDVLTAAEQGVSGDTRQHVEQARKAVDALVTEASSAADGAPVDDAAVTEAEQQLDDAVEDISTVC